MSHANTVAALLGIVPLRVLSAVRHPNLGIMRQWCNGAVTLAEAEERQFHVRKFLLPSGDLVYVDQDSGRRPYALYSDGTPPGSADWCARHYVAVAEYQWSEHPCPDGLALKRELTPNADF